MAATRTTWTKIRAMTTEELKVLALEKGLRGNASEAALMAQKELIARRNGDMFKSNHALHFDKLSDEI